MRIQLINNNQHSCYRREKRKPIIVIIWNLLTLHPSSKTLPANQGTSRDLRFSHIRTPHTLALSSQLLAAVPLNPRRGAFSDSEHASALTLLPEHVKWIRRRLSMCSTYTYRLCMVSYCIFICYYPSECSSLTLCRVANVSRAPGLGSLSGVPGGA